MGIKAPLSLCLRPIFRCEWAAGWGEAPGRQGPQVAEGQNPWPGVLWTGGHTPGHRPERLGAPVHRFLSPEPRGNPAEGIGLHQPGQASQPLSSTWVGGKPTDWTPLHLPHAVLFPGSRGWHAYSMPQIPRLTGPGCSLRKRAAQAAQSVVRRNPGEGSGSGEWRPRAPTQPFIFRVPPSPYLSTLRHFLINIGYSPEFPMWLFYIIDSTALTLLLLSDCVCSSAGLPGVFCLFCQTVTLPCTMNLTLWCWSSENGFTLGQIQ